MAQTKAKPKSKSAAKRPKASSKPKASKSTKSAKSKSSSSKSSKPRSSSSSSNGTVKTVGKVAGKAKVPLVAGGAAIAGAAGGMALAASKRARKNGLTKAMMRRPKVKIDSKDVAKAAKEVGNFSAQVGELADELKRARKSANGKHRSPVEVVLQGLTARR